MGSVSASFTGSAKAVRDTASADAMPMLEIRKVRREDFIDVLRCSDVLGDAVLFDGDVREHINVASHRMTQMTEIRKRRRRDRTLNIQTLNMLATFSAIASDAVSPGDSMPNRFTSPTTPCAARP